jgi:hypothetical protein
VAKGANASATTNEVDTFLIASTGNASDFGDLSVARSGSGATSNKVTAVVAGGTDTSARTNVIDSVTIGTSGTFADFGDLTEARNGLAGVSNAHGGLS